MALKRLWFSWVAGVPLFTPRVPVVVIAERFPEPGLLTLHEMHPPHPFRTLPEVEMRHREARGTAVLRREWHSTVFHRHPRLAAGQVGERQVGRIAAI